MNARLPLHFHNEGVVRVGNVDLHLAKGDVDGHTDVHVGELGLGREEDGAATWQVADVGLMEAVGLRGGVEAALMVHVELPVALTAIHRSTIEGVLTFSTLDKIGGEKQAGCEELWHYIKATGIEKY